MRGAAAGEQMSAESSSPPASLRKRHISRPLAKAVEKLASSDVVQDRGAVFTRKEVVDFILDLCGYTVDRPLHDLRVLEPSFGGGDFLLPTIDRLVKAWQFAGRGRPPVKALHGCIRAVELHRVTFEKTRSDVAALLDNYGFSRREVAGLLNAWLLSDDFLLADLPGNFDVVVGNPPYVRQERIPDLLLAEYRSRYRTIFDRADLYIPFIERSLQLLSERGVLGFICADRWMKNRYGGPLRKLISESYHLKCYVDMVDTPAFRSDVIAYPAITIIAQGCGTETRVARRPQIDHASLGVLARALTSSRRPAKEGAVQVLRSVAGGAEPWILGSSHHMAVIRRLESAFPLIEEAGCRVAIGVATGADKAFIAPMAELHVEEDRKLPLVMTKDITGGTVQWRGLGVINPFSATGGLVDLNRFPLLRAYLDVHKDQITRRHCAKKAPESWYRTIDRIKPEIAATPKLLIPDIKGTAHIVYENGTYYPHHNLYYVTSDRWDLRALQAVLLSSVTQLFMLAYSTKMRGGFIRFQAQYLRRIRLPLWEDVPQKLRTTLSAAAVSGDLMACNEATSELYGLDSNERAMLSATGDAP